jgi:hypothetical protein
VRVAGPTPLTIACYKAGVPRGVAAGRMGVGGGVAASAGFAAPSEVAGV